MSNVIIKAWNAALGKAQNVRASYNALKTVGTVHERIHTGWAFSHANKREVAPAGASLDHLIIVDSGYTVHLVEHGFVSSAGPDDAYLYENPFTDVLSLGLDVTPEVFNRNRASSNTPHFTIHEQPFTNVLSLGTELDYALMEQSTGGPIKAAGGGAEAIGMEWVLTGQNAYLVRLTNNHATDSATVQEKLFMYEPVS